MGLGDCVLDFNRGGGSIMSSDVTKRALSAGLAVGALALLAPRASADTPFSSFAFPATGSPTARTMPDRLAETKNVKDFGARGNGSTDDTAAIQAAVTAAHNSGGAVFFPPGNYRVTSTIRAEGGNPNFLFISLIGSGIWSTIAGNFPGWLVDLTGGPSDNASMVTVEKLSFNNGHPNGGGLRLASAIVTTVKECVFSGHKGIALYSTKTSSIRDCRFTSLHGGIAGQTSRAILSIRANQLIIDNCDFNGFWRGVQATQAVAVTNCRFEMNHVGVLVGMDEDGGSWASGCYITGTSFEANDTGIWCFGSVGVISAVNVQGSTYAPQADERPGGGNAHYGLRLDKLHRMFISSVNSGGHFDNAAIYVGQAVYTTFISVEGEILQPASGVAWQLPADRAHLTLIQCNQG
jgi:hypothetical protein